MFALSVRGRLYSAKTRGWQRACAVLWSLLAAATAQAKGARSAQSDRSIGFLGGEETHLVAYRDLVAGGTRSIESLIYALETRLAIAEVGHLERSDVRVAVGAMAALEEIADLDNEQVASLVTLFQHRYHDLPDRVRVQFGMLVGRVAAGQPSAKDLLEFLRKSEMKACDGSLVGRMLCRLDWSALTLSNVEARLAASDPLEIEAAAHYLMSRGADLGEARPQILLHLTAIGLKPDRDLTRPRARDFVLSGEVGDTYPGYARRAADWAAYRLTLDSTELADVSTRIRGCCVAICESSSPIERLQAVGNVRLFHEFGSSGETWKDAAPAVVAALTHGLEDLCLEVRLECAVTLGMLGKVAAPALSALEGIWRDASENRALRLIVRRASVQIQEAREK